jgi:hypothetical protein
VCEFSSSTAGEGSLCNNCLLKSSTCAKWHAEPMCPCRCWICTCQLRSNCCLNLARGDRPESRVSRYHAKPRRRSLGHEVGRASGLASNIVAGTLKVINSLLRQKLAGAHLRILYNDLTLPWKVTPSNEPLGSI